MAQEIIAACVQDGEHATAAQKLLDAAHDYWRWRQKSGLHGAVLWIRDDGGRLIVFTRGEYAESIERAIRQETGIAAGPPWGDVGHA